MSGPRGVLPSKRVAAIKSKTRVVVSSDYSASKQVVRHVDIAPEDYVFVQQLMDHGKAVMDQAGNLVFLGTVKGHEFKAVVKRTKDGRELYLKALHRLRPGQADTIRKRRE